MKNLGYPVLGVLLCVGVLYHCSSAKVRVVSTPKGINRAVVLHPQKKQAESTAVIAANDYCVGHKKSVVYLRDHTLPINSLGNVDYRSEVIFRCD